MPTNFPGPYAVEINYQVTGLNHKMLLNTIVDGSVTVGQDPTTINLLTKGGGTVALSTAVDAWVTLMRGELTSAADISTYDFWQYTTGTFERTYVTSGAIGVSGNSSGANVLAGYRRVSFRTQVGGIGYFTLLEGVGTGSEQFAPPFPRASTRAIADFMISDDAWMIARDNGYFVAPIRESQGQNESVFRKRYR